MSFYDATLVALRESLEAFLIISIFAGLVMKLGHRDARKYLLWGAAAAVGASIAIGTILYLTMKDVFEGEGGPIFEGIATLIAVCILTYMIVWMYRHTLEIVGSFRVKAHAALAANKPGLLFGLAFVAVAREGLETVFLFGALYASTTAAALVTALLLGLAVSGIIAFLVFTGTARLNIKKFFAVTGVLLIFFSAGLLVTTIHEFGEVGWLPETRKAWNTESLLDQHGMLGSFVKAVFGYRESPTTLEATAYFAYVLGIGAWYLAGILRRSGRAIEQPAPQTSGPENVA